MYHFTNHHVYHQNPYPQQCPIYMEHTKHPASATITTQNHPVFNETSVPINPNNSAVGQEPDIPPPVVDKQEKTVTNKSCVDTSNFSIEERLVAAVWVHERKHTKSSMSQIKHDFRQRFGREPPAKNTLLVWERKLFSTGRVHDAPRTGRPANRLHRIDEVAASVRAAPSMSLRARALSLRVARTTLRVIMHKDLANPTIAKGKKVKQSAKREMKSKADCQTEQNVVVSVPSHPQQRNIYVNH